MNNNTRSDHKQDSGEEQITEQVAPEATAHGHENWPPTGAELVAAPTRDPVTGRFLKGHPALPGGGRPPKSREQQNLDLLHEVMDQPIGDSGMTRKSALILSTVRAALTGDSKARELLCRYLLPPPIEAHDVRMLTLHGQIDGDEHQGEAIPPWEEEDAPALLAGAIETLRDLGYLQLTEQWHQKESEFEDETVVNDFHPLKETNPV
jgi:hypothetical protein